MIRSFLAVTIHNPTIQLSSRGYEVAVAIFADCFAKFTPREFEGLAMTKSYQKGEQLLLADEFAERLAAV